MTGEQFLNYTLLANEEATVNIMCSFRRTLDDTGVIRSILVEILKTVIVRCHCIKGICTCSHKTASLETRRQNAAKTVLQLVL
jgi:hypothetical protein